VKQLRTAGGADLARFIEVRPGCHDAPGRRLHHIARMTSLLDYITWKLGAWCTRLGKHTCSVFPHVCMCSRR